MLLIWLRVFNCSKTLSHHWDYLKNVALVAWRMWCRTFTLIFLLLEHCCWIDVLDIPNTDLSLWSKLFAFSVKHTTHYTECSHMQKFHWQATFSFYWLNCSNPQFNFLELGNITKSTHQVVEVCTRDRVWLSRSTLNGETEGSPQFFISWQTH